MSRRYYIGVPLVVVSGSLVWEIFARKKKSNIKPSTALNFIAKKSSDLFTNLADILPPLK